ncbi:MAG: urea ABC transporter permease subunit UrtC [Chloroflexi bacterium]|nr:urea ABC transporter permease subunit UrtC [Chloroflexota bacterium]
MEQTIGTQRGLAPTPASRLIGLAQGLLPVVVLAVVLGVIAPMVLSDFRLSLLGKFMCFAMIAIGLDLIWGYTGMLSLGHGVWFGLGGYALAMHMKIVAAQELGDPIPDFMTWSGIHALPFFWKPFVSLPVSLAAVVLVPGILAFCFGLLVFRSRVKGAYFSIITQALALSLSIMIVGKQEWTGGTNGLTSYTSLFGMNLMSPATQHTLYYATVIALLVIYLAAKWIVSSPFGRVMIAIRDDEDRVRFTGYNVGVVKAIVFAISAMFAGVAGALFATQVGIISPADIAIVPSIEFVLLVAVGGRGTLLGPIIGALLVGGARSALSENFPASWQFFYGALFVGAVLLFPAGLVGVVQQQWKRWRGKSSKIATPASMAVSTEEV